MVIQRKNLISLYILPDQRRGNLLVKYKPISGRLKEHFGFKLLADGNIKNADNVYCIHSAEVLI